MLPSVGRVVHFHPRVPRDTKPGPPQAAIIVDIDPKEGLGAGSADENSVGVYLCVLTRSCATWPGTVVRYHPDGAPGTWRWPPREVPAQVSLGINTPGRGGPG
jgi:hypothetical protein